jgi:hypothetical protein
MGYLVPSSSSSDLPAPVPVDGAEIIDCDVDDEPCNGADDEPCNGSDDEPRNGSDDEPDNVERTSEPDYGADDEPDNVERSSEPVNVERSSEADNVERSSKADNGERAPEPDNGNRSNLGADWVEVSEEVAAMIIHNGLEAPRGFVWKDWEEYNYWMKRRDARVEREDRARDYEIAREEAEAKRARSR